VARGENTEVMVYNLIYYSLKNKASNMLMSI
jgi:hypothetical protein